MKLFLILGAILSGIAAFSQLDSKDLEQSEITNDTWQRARIFYKSQENLALLSAQGLALDHGKKKPGVYIESDFTVNQLSIARMLGCDVEVLIEDVQAHYREIGSRDNLKEKSFEPKNTSCSGGGAGAPTYTTPSNWELGSMGGCYTYNEMIDELDDMVALYPNLITAKAPISTFKTEENRDIYWVKISDNPNTDEAEPEMLYDAIHHAREPVAMQQLIYYMWYLLENYATNSEVKSIVDNTELYFIPVLNPDGYQYNSTQSPNGGGMWRKNRRNNGGGKYGVDNNRNYDFIDPVDGNVWNTTGVSSDPAGDTYPGTSAFSEVENQAMKWFCENHDFRIALNNHTWDNSLLYPYGYENNKLTPENSTYLAISDMMVQYNGLGMTAMLSSNLYPASGDSDDWGYGHDLATKPRIFSFTPEIGDDGFWPNINSVEDQCNSMVWTNLTAAHLITNYAKTEDVSDFTVTDLTGYFKYEIQRLGLEDPANFTVSLNPISSNILSVGTSNLHNGMTLLQTDLDSVSYSLDPSINAGDVINYEIVVDNGYFVESINVEKIYGAPTPIFTDAGNNVSNWTTSQSWAATSQDYYSPSTSITDSPNGEYNNQTNSSIILDNAFDLSTSLSATVSFYAKWVIEDNYDYVQFEVSTDNGSTWTPQCGNYTNTGTGDQDAGKPLYDGTQNSWVKEEINLSEYLGQTVKFRFQLISDQFVTEDGFYFDDFEVSVINASSQGVSEESLELSGYPNPANNLFNISYNLNGLQNGNLIVTDKLGKLIEVMSIDARGSLVINTSDYAEGMYFYTITSDERKSETKKFIVTK